MHGLTQNTDQVKKQWKLLRRSELYHIMAYHPSNDKKSRIKYEDTVKSRLWRLYGKTLWNPIQRFVRRSVNTYSSNMPKYNDNWIRRMFPTVVQDEFYSCDWVLFEKIKIKSGIWPHRFLFGWALRTIKEFYSKHAYNINNPEYRMKFCWFRPLIYVAKLVNYIYHAEYTCCGYNRWLCDEDEDSRVEILESGVEGTMDGTNYWARGFIHCPRCNTPLKYQSDSL